jgi:hypothetical protein
MGNWNTFIGNRSAPRPFLVFFTKQFGKEIVAEPG